jgi:hypothetical protein
MGYGDGVARWWAERHNKTSAIPKENMGSENVQGAFEREFPFPLGSLIVIWIRTMVRFVLRQTTKRREAIGGEILQIRFRSASGLDIPVSGIPLHLHMAFLRRSLGPDRIVSCDHQSTHVVSMSLCLQAMYLA